MFLFLACLQKAGLSYQLACQAHGGLPPPASSGPEALVPNRALRGGIFRRSFTLSLGVQSMARLVRRVYITLTLAVAACLLGWVASHRAGPG